MRLIAKNAKAWDSIKSPSILYLSIFSKVIVDKVFSFIFLIKILFFLPPPQIIMFCIFSLEFFIDKDNSSPIMLAVNSVRVATPSSKFKPLTKDMSKSFVSNDNLFLLFLFVYNSCACSKITSFFLPIEARFPSKSNLLFELLLTHVSIRQLPGPISLLYIPDKLSLFVTMVIFEMPPIFKKHIGNLNLFCTAIN